MRLNLTIVAREKAKKALGAVANGAKRMGDTLRRSATSGSSGMRRLGAAANRLDHRLAATSRRAARFAGRLALGAIHRSAMLAARGVGFLIGRTVRLGAQLALIGGSAAASLASWSVGKAISNASTLEKLRFKFGEIDGNAASAARSVRKLREFILNSPVDGDKLIEGYSRLRDLKIKPTTDLFGGLVDASVATGRELTEIVEAYAATSKKEFDSLGEALGISIEEAGRNAVIKYDKAGKPVVKRVRNTVKAIQAEVEKALVNKFGGAAQRYQRTWAGMWGALKNKYNEFLNQVADAGLFDMVKERLGGLLDRLTAWVQSGEMEIYAKKVSAQLEEWATRAEDFVRGINWDQVKSDVASLAESLADAAESMREIYSYGSGVSEFLNKVQNSGGDLNKWFRKKLGMPSGEIPVPGQKPAQAERWLPGWKAPAQKVDGKVEVMIRTAPGVAATASARSTGPVRTIAKRGPSMAGAA